MRNVLIAVTTVALMASPVAAKPPLRDVPAVDDALLDLHRNHDLLLAKIIYVFPILKFEDIVID